MRGVMGQKPWKQVLRLVGTDVGRIVAGAERLLDDATDFAAIAGINRWRQPPAEHIASAAADNPSALAGLRRRLHRPPQHCSLSGIAAGFDSPQRGRNGQPRRVTSSNRGSASQCARHCIRPARPSPSWSAAFIIAVPTLSAMDMPDIALNARRPHAPVLREIWWCWNRLSRGTTRAMAGQLQRLRRTCAREPGQGGERFRGALRAGIRRDARIVQATGWSAAERLQHERAIAPTALVEGECVPRMPKRLSW
jgi:hypothetical protein